MKAAQGEAYVRALGKRLISRRPGSGVPGEILSLEFLKYTSSRSPRSLYILDAADVPLLRLLPASGERFFAFVCCNSGEPPFFTSAENVDVCFVALSPLELYSELSAVLLRERQSDSILSRELCSDLASLSDAFCAQFGVGLVFLNAGWQFICGSLPPGMKDARISELFELGYLTAKLIAEWFGAQSPSVQALGDDLRLRALSVQSGGVGLNLLVLFSPELAKTAGHVCRKLGLFLKGLDADSLQQLLPPVSPGSPRYIGSVFGGNCTEEADIRRRLCAESPSKFFALSIIIPDPGLGDRAWYDETARVLSSVYSDYVFTVYGGNIVCVAFWDNHGDMACFTRADWRRELFLFPSPKTVLAQLADARRITFCTGAVTRFFGSIRVIYDYYITILRTAQALDPRNRVIFCEEYDAFAVIALAMDSYVEKYGAQKLWCLLYPDIVTILRADLISDRGLSDVLFAWLANGGSIAKTASALFMHKNTVYAKIKKIEEIIKIDFEDSLSVQNYLLSLMVVKYCQKVLGLDMRSIVAAPDERENRAE